MTSNVSLSLALLEPPTGMLVSPPSTVSPDALTMLVCIHTSLRVRLVKFFRQAVPHVGGASGVAKSSRIDRPFSPCRIRLNSCDISSHMPDVVLGVPPGGGA